VCSLPMMTVLRRFSILFTMIGEWWLLGWVILWNLVLKIAPVFLHREMIPHRCSSCCCCCCGDALQKTSLVNMSEYNPSLLGGLNWGRGCFVQSHYPTVVYMTFFSNDEIRKFFPGFDSTLSEVSIQSHELKLINVILSYTKPGEISII